MRRTKKKGARSTSENKKVRNAKAMTLPDGTKFRSKLELFTYQKLLEAGINDFKYEEDKFILLEAFDYPNESYEAYERKDKDNEGARIKYFDDAEHNIRNMTYLPDFTRLDHETKKGWILEVKGFSNDSFPIKWKIFKSYLLKNGYDVTLYKPNNQGNVLKCVQMIKDRYYAEKS